MSEEWKYKTKAENLEKSIGFAFGALSGMEYKSMEYRILFEAIVTLEGLLRLQEGQIKLGLE